MGDWLRRTARWKALCIVGVGEALAVPCLVVALIAGDLPLFLVLLFTAQVLGGISVAPTYATLQALLKSNTHAQATAIYLFCVSGLGLALGPVVTGMMSDAMSDRGSQASLQTALLLLMLLKLWAAAHYGLSGYRLFRRDREEVDAPVAQPAAP
jgi:MFS family permease